MVYDMQRYFIIKNNDKYRLQDGDFHHIKDVMRLKSGDNIILVFDGISYLGTINYDKNDYKLTLISKLDIKTEIEKKVILYQALIKNDNFDLVVQKACEIGVTDFYPVMMERCVIKINDDKKIDKINRYKKIIKEASEQSHRQKEMVIHDFINIKNINKNDNELGFVAYENNDDFYIFSKKLEDVNKYDAISMIIGPEGGFSNDEIKLLENKGFINVSLGRRILRSETAAINSMSIICHYIEDRKYE